MISLATDNLIQFNLFKMSRNYGEYYFNLPSNDEGNKLLDSFSKALSGDLTVKERIQIATKDQDNVFIGADAEQNVIVLHSVNN